MMFFPLLAALALAGLGVWMSRRRRNVGQAMMGLGGLGLIAVIVLQVRQNVFPSQPKAPSRYKMAVSYGLANCLLQDATGQSGKVVLLFPQRSAMDAATEESYEEGFIPALRHGRRGLALKAVHLEGANRDLAAFKQALAQTPEALAILSFAGVPPGSETLFPARATEGPLFYVFDGEGTATWLEPLKEGRIKAVIVPRPGVDVRSGEGASGSPEAIFEKFYLIATSANADEIAASLKTKPPNQR